LAEQISSHFRSKLDSITLVPSSGGVFNVSADLDGTDVIFSKKKEGRFPEWDEIREALESRQKKD